MKKVADDDSALLTPFEVADLFGVSVQTVARWARKGTFNAIRTLGGHRRYRRAEIMAFLNGQDGR